MLVEEEEEERDIMKKKVCFVSVKERTITLCSESGQEGRELQ